MPTETKPCTRCQREQPLNQYHRRGQGYQNICKTCRNSEISAYCKRRSSGTLIRKKEHSINKENFHALFARIEKLEAQLRNKAQAFSSDNMDADDLYSLMVEEILTKSLPEEPDAYLLQRANWVAQGHIAKTLTYRTYVEEYELDETVLLDTNPRLSHGSPHSMETEIINKENMNEIETIIKSLPSENQHIITMVSFGASSSEIAKSLKISEPKARKKIEDSMFQLGTLLGITL